MTSHMTSMLCTIKYPCPALLSRILTTERPPRANLTFCVISYHGDYTQGSVGSSKVCLQFVCISMCCLHLVGTYWIIFFGKYHFRLSSRIGKVNIASNRNLLGISMVYMEHTLHTSPLLCLQIVLPINIYLYVMQQSYFDTWQLIDLIRQAGVLLQHTRQTCHHKGALVTLYPPQLSYIDSAG